MSKQDDELKQHLNGFENVAEHIILEGSTKHKAEFYWPQKDDAEMKTILKWSAIFWSIVTIIFLIVDQIYHKEFMTQSIQIIIYLQSLNSPAFDTYNKTLAKACDLAWAYWPFIALYFYKDKRLFVKTYSAMLFTLWFKNCLKLIYLDDRPNILSDQVSALRCKCEFGRPSGTLINSTTIIMFIAWDMFARNRNLKLWLRILIMLIAKVLVAMVIFSILYMGFHAWNQMVDSVLLAMTMVYILCYYEKQVCYFFHTIIDHRLNYRQTKRNIIICFGVFIAFLAIYLIIFTCQYHVKDFTIALQGACPQCAYKNWCDETILQDTTAVGFPAMILFFALRCHKFVYSEAHLSDTWTFNVRQQGWWKKNLRGILRFVISYAFWAPIIYWYFPHFATFGASAASTPIKNLLGAFLFFMIRPFLFKWLKLDVRGDIEELSQEDRVEWKDKSSK